MAMSAAMKFGVFIPVAYLIGAIPFGLLVGWAKGIDVRKAGSGNIGATNVGRLLGKKFFFVVFFLDMLKGMVPMMIAAALLPVGAGEMLYVLCLVVGLATIVGHMFSVFLGFKGGKGVSTSFGVILGFYPYFTYPAIIAILIFTLVLFTTRYVSVASIIGSSSVPVGYFIIGILRGWHPLTTQLPLLIFVVLIASLIVIKHRGNIARLRAGTESRIKTRAQRMADRGQS